VLERPINHPAQIHNKIVKRIKEIGKNVSFKIIFNAIYTLKPKQYRKSASSYSFNKTLLFLKR